MDKRTFLKQFSLLTVGMSPALNALGTMFDEVKDVPAMELAKMDEFWQRIRFSYELTDEYINLENGYYCMLPSQTLEKYTEHVRNVNRQASYYMRKKLKEDTLRARQDLACLSGCKLEEVVITRNATESLDLVIQGIHWKKKDEAIMAEQDYGAMLNMFRLMEERYGIVNKRISIPSHPKSDEEIVKLYEDQITKKTRLIMISHVININGHVLPVRKICDMAHSHGVEVLVDGAHAFAHLDFKIPELNCDYYGTSLHKWLSAPLGAGMLYVKEDKIKNLWPLFAERELPEDDIERINHTGTKPVHVDLGIIDAIEFHKMIGSYRKQERLKFLKKYWTEKVKDIPGIDICTPFEPERSCGIANVLVEGMTPSEMEKKLMEQYRIYVVPVDRPNVRGCRVTPNVFTSLEELDSLVRALTEMSDKVNQ